MGCARRQSTLPKRFSVKGTASINPVSCAVSMLPGLWLLGGPGPGSEPEAGLSAPQELVPRDCKQLDIWPRHSWGRQGLRVFVSLRSSSQRGGPGWAAGRAVRKTFHFFRSFLATVLALRREHWKCQGSTSFSLNDPPHKATEAL